MNALTAVHNNAVDSGQDYSGFTLIGPWVLTCCVDLCSGLPFSQSDKPDSIMDRFSR